MLELYLVLCKYKLRNSFFPVTNAVWQETIICSVSNVTFGVHLACRNFILCNKEPSWYSANQWESSLKKMKKHLICTHPSSTGLSYGDRISFGLSCFYTEVQRKWVCFLSCILIYSRTLWTTLRSIIASPKCKMELGRKTEQFKKKKISLLWFQVPVYLYRKCNSGSQGSSQLSNHFRLQRLQNTKDNKMHDSNEGLVRPWRTKLQLQRGILRASEVLKRSALKKSQACGWE